MFQQAKVQETEGEDKAWYMVVHLTSKKCAFFNANYQITNFYQEDNLDKNEATSGLVYVKA